jgi:hypothetical protein
VRSSSEQNSVSILRDKTEIVGSARTRYFGAALEQLEIAFVNATLPITGRSMLITRHSEEYQETQQATEDHRMQIPGGSRQNQRTDPGRRDILKKKEHDHPISG